MPVLRIAFRNEVLFSIHLLLSALNVDEILYRERREIVSHFIFIGPGYRGKKAMFDIEHLLLLDAGLYSLELPISKAQGSLKVHSDIYSIEGEIAFNNY